MVVAFWSQNVTFDSIGDEMSGVFESHFLAFLQGVFPQNDLAFHRHNCVCPPARAAVFILITIFKGTKGLFSSSKSYAAL